MASSKGDASKGDKSKLDPDPTKGAESRPKGSTTSSIGAIAAGGVAGSFGGLVVTIFEEDVDLRVSDGCLCREVETCGDAGGVAAGEAFDDPPEECRFRCSPSGSVAFKLELELLVLSNS